MKKILQIKSKLKKLNQVEELDVSEVWDYMVKEIGFGIMRIVAESEFPKCSGTESEDELYNCLWQNDYLDTFVSRFGSMYYNLYKDDSYGVGNTIIDELEMETGRNFNQVF